MTLKDGADSKSILRPAAVCAARTKIPNAQGEVSTILALDRLGHAIAASGSVVMRLAARSEKST